MPVSDKTSLKELKALIKEHAKSLPKMSSGKTALALYAEKNGLLKRPDPEVVPAPVKAKKELPPITKAPAKKSAPVEAIEPVFQKQKAMPELHKSLIKKPVAPVEPAKKAPSGFALFMSQNKGQGYNMAQMSQMYRESKEQS